MTKRLEHLTYEERLRLLGVQPGEEKAEGDLSHVHKYERRE